MMGITQLQIFKVFGYINKTKVMMVIDSGSSQNFIDTKITKQLNIFFYPTFDFEIAILRDRTTSCDGKCNKI
jgi:hypothetical protein